MMSRYGARWAIGLVLTLLAGAQVQGIVPAGLNERIDLFIYDMRMRVLPHPLDSRIAIVNIDEKSLAEVGRWPWSRDVIADLVDKMAGHYQAKAIGFDVAFIEPDTSSGYAILETLARTELKDMPSFGQSLQALKPALDYDGRLARALKDKPVVLGYYMSSEPDAFPKGSLPPPAFTVADLGGRKLDALTWKAYGANLDVLQRAAAAGGFFNPLPDPDGVIRSVPLLGQLGDRYYESLALATARIALGATAIRPIFLSDQDVRFVQDKTGYGALDAIALNSTPRATRIPVERNLMTLIEFRGPGGADGGGFRYVSAVDVLKGRLPKESLA